MNNMDEKYVLTASDVALSFGKKTVLDSVNLELPRGKIYGVTGANGAGKSVLLRCLSGFIRPTRGEVRVFGKKIGMEAEFAPNTGVLIDSPGFLRSASAPENLTILAAVSGSVPTGRILEVLSVVDLNGGDDRPVSCYSSGMMQRLYLAQALMEDPDLLLLDEPTNMLDVDGQRQIYDLIVELNRAGKTILLTSNYPDELKILCDQVFKLDAGRLAPYEIAERAAFAVA